jgi:hypothetical protein
MAQCELAYMTWKEVEAARDRGAAVLVPIGTHEQNGTLGPMGTTGCSFSRSRSGSPPRRARW